MEHLFVYSLVSHSRNFEHLTVYIKKKKTVVGMTDMAKIYLGIHVIWPFKTVFFSIILAAPDTCS